MPAIGPRSARRTRRLAGTALAVTFWQYADHGSLPGDQDVFNGPYTQLQVLAKNG